MRPYYLDGDLAQHDLTLLAERFDLAGPGDTRFSRRLSMAADCGFCAVFKDRGEALRRLVFAHVGHAIQDVSPRRPADAGLSKLNSMLGSFCDRGRLCSPSRKGDARSTVIQPGSVDMLGPTARHHPVLRALEELEAGRPLRSGHCMCSLERR
jgi:hypothetical protein